MNQAAEDARNFIAKLRDQPTAWILLVAGLVVFVRVRSVRKPTLIVLGVLTLAFGGFWFNAYHQQRLAEERVKTSQKLVNGDQLVFMDMRLGPVWQGATSYRLTGRIKNTSLFPVWMVRAKIQIRDCQNTSVRATSTTDSFVPAESCETIGEQSVTFNTGSIPVGQVRDIDDRLYFGEQMHVRGILGWNYSIEEIRAGPQ